MTAFDVAADFDANGSYETTLRATSFTSSRGLDPVTFAIRSGSAQVTLKNHDALYSPRKTTSALYPTVQPGKGIRARREDSGAVAHSQFTGFIREISLNPDPGVLTATFDCVDLLDKLQRVKVTTPLYENYRSDQLIAAILTLAGYTGSTSLATGARAFPYAAWSKTSALDAIQQVVNSELGSFFISAAGVPTFHARYYRTNTAAASATVSNTQSQLEYRRSWAGVFNDISVTVHPVLAGTPDVLWEWAEVPRVIAPGESIAIEAEFSTLADDLITPVYFTDYYPTGLTISSFVSYGRSATFTAANNTAAAITVTYLRVRGTPLNESSVTLRATNATSQTAYGLLPAAYDLPLETQVETGQDIANYFATIYADPTDQINIALDPANSTRIDYIANLELDQRIDFTNSNAGLTAVPFFIDGIDIALGDHPNSQVSTYRCSALPTIAFIVLGSGTQTFADLLGA